MNSKGLVLDIIISFVITVVVLSALSPLIVLFHSTFVTGTGANPALFGILYYFIYGIPLFLAIGGITLFIRTKIAKQNTT